MADNSVTLRIGADPTRLETGLRQSSASINSFGVRARASIARVGSSLRGLADRMVTPFNSLVLGGGLGMAIKNVGDLSEALMYYGFAAKKSDADTKVFRDSLHKTAVETGVAANEILNGVSKIGEITGKFDFAEEMGANLAKAAKASGASVEDLASVAASLSGSMGYGADQVQKAFNALIIQGEAGSFTLKGFASQGRALLASASSAGIKTSEQFAKFGSFLQIVNEKIKSEAETTTSVSTLFSELIDKAGDIQKKFGVKVLDKNKEMREFDVIIKEIMEKTGGKLNKLSPVFGASSMKAIYPLIAEYKNGWERMDQIAKDGIEGMTNTSVLQKYYEKASNSFNGNIGKMTAVAHKFADENLTGPVESLTNALKFLNEHQGIVTAGFTTMKYAALALGAVKIGGLVKDAAALGRDLKGFWSKKFGSDSSSLKSAVDTVQKVYVVNMGGGMGSANYMDDDDLPVTTRKTATAMETTTKEVGRFRQGLSNARAGLNRLRNSPLAMSVMGAATSWAMGQIYNFGQAFIEWRQVVANSREIAANTIDTNAKSFEERYGKNAHAKRYDETLKAIQEEENSFLPSQKKLDKLYAQLNVSRKLMAQDIASGAHRVSAQEYMQNLTVAPNIVINLDASNNRFTAQSDGGKPANIRVKNTPGMGR
ncbi:MAG: phage tail tape measure protein [Fibrobacter sp.]|nr:phage tail tape measure protein [Fibrobacter sp.]